MSVEVLHLLVRVTLASSVALLLVFVLRRLLRALAGARAAYALWLLVPALVLASLLPAPSQQLMRRSLTLPPQLNSALQVDVGSPSRDRTGTLTVLLAVWGVGVVAMSFAVVRRQRAF